ncbi:PucR family transcriptional regulator [Streptomyces sp. NPDC051907]|uniref:PucR family transcriptional regulator n=1 Tax=Streptomyces sp. NPDC051907 TaxID=3155284 RepID=UPI00343B0D6C
MHVEDLLQIDSLDLTLLWAEDPLLSREISGVTATDLEDPARFLQQGEIVLSGLVWWSRGDGRAKIDRFVSALRSTGATALLAGEETHGAVPDEVVDSCREHRIALLAVPAHTSFRAVTEAVYLRQWGDLSRRPTHHYSLPENVRNELSGLLDRDAGPDELLDRAFAHLGTVPGYLLTASGRTVARTPSAPPLPVRRALESLHGASHPGVTLRVQADGTPYDAWRLHLPDAADAPPRVLHEIAEVLAQYRHHHDRRQAARRQSADELIALVDDPAADANALEAALRSCGLPARGPYRVLAATLGADGRPGAAGALAEALRHRPSALFAVAERPGGEAVAVVHDDADTADADVPGSGADEAWPGLDDVWGRLQDCDPDDTPHAGVSTATQGPQRLNAALVQARYALASARTTASRAARMTSVADLATLGSLLAGVPADVRAAYRAKTLGPLLQSDSASHTMLLKTLEVFLANHCSWARTAEALHLHVNTVHYRVQRIEALTGRDLSRLDDRLDLRAALLCR